MSEMDARADDLTEPRLDRRDGFAGGGLEAAEADAADQHQAVRDDQPPWPRQVPFDVDPADAADQNRFVELDEDEYR